MRLVLIHIRSPSNLIIPLLSQITCLGNLTKVIHSQHLILLCWWRSRPRLARPQRTTGSRDRRTSSGDCCKSHSPADAGCWRRHTPSRPSDRATDAKKRDTSGTPRTCTPAPAKHGTQTSITACNNYVNIWRVCSHGNSGTPLSNKPLEALWLHHVWLHLQWSNSLRSVLGSNSDCITPSQVFPRTQCFPHQFREPSCHKGRCIWAEVATNST